MEKVEAACKEANPLIKTRIMQADFSNVTRNKESEVLAFYAQLKTKLDDLDVAILVNNAGVMYTGRIDETPADSQKWKEIIDVDVMHIGMMNSTFQGKLMKRQADSQGKLKSAIVNVSSGIGYSHGAAGCAVYCASKGYVNFYSVAQAFENKGDIDVQCLTPGLTRTNLLKDISQKASGLVSISSADCALGSLRDLGHPDTYLTGGDIRHDIMTVPVGFFSRIPLIQYAFGFIFSKVFKH